MTVRRMARCGLMTGAMAVCGWLSVPIGDTVVSMQTFALFLTLGLLGGKLGSVVCLSYLILGGVGLPVFTGGQGGFGILLGPTGGYLWGFLAASLLYWLLEKHLRPWVCMVLGLVLCYACGTAWYAMAYGPIPLWAVVLKCVVPYLLPDALKLGLSVMMAGKLTCIVDR